MDEHEKLRRAMSQVEAIKGFYIHLTVFVLVMLLLLAINWANLPGWWVQWPFLGWGLGVIGHAFAVYGRSSRALSKWEHDKVRTLVDKM